MSIVVEATFRDENDDLIDPDTVVLADVTDTFGVKRLDTEVVVVAAGAAMTRISEGVYQYTFVPPEPLLRYEYAVKSTIDTVDTFMTGIIDAAYAYTQGRYATVLGLIKRFGRENILKWADIAADQEDSISPAITQAITLADDLIDGVLELTLYDVPFTAPAPAIICQIADILAGCNLYDAKGSIDFDPETGRAQNRLASQRRWAETTLDRIRKGWISLIGVTRTSAVGICSIEESDRTLYGEDIRIRECRSAELTTLAYWFS